MADKIRVVHLITLLEYGGAQGNTIHTVTHLNSERFEAHLWAGRGGYWDTFIEDELKPQGRIRFFPHLKRSLNIFSDLFIVLDLYRALRRFKPQVLHTHSSKAGIVGRLAAKWAGIPVVLHTFHGFGFNPVQKPWVRWLFVVLERWCASMADKLIFVSESNQRLAQKLKIGVPSQYVLIRSGIPVAECRKKAAETIIEAYREKLKLGTNKIVTTIGPFKPQKNLLDFVDVAAELNQRDPTIRFLMVGDGAGKTEVEAKIRQNNLESIISLLGWRDDVPSILALSNIFVMTSLWEGLPRSLVESLCLGKPAVCYDTDGVRDVLEKGGGFLVPPGNKKLMVEKIVNLLSDPGLYNLYSEMAKNAVGIEFDIDYMVRQQEVLYTTLLDRDVRIK